MDDCSLLIRHFPAELAETVKSISKEQVLTKAVLHCLMDYISLRRRFSSLKLKSQDLQSDLDQVLHVWRLQKDLDEQIKKVQDLLSDPNRFYLHGD